MPGCLLHWKAACAAGTGSVCCHRHVCASHSRGPPCRGWTAFCIGWRVGSELTHGALAARVKRGAGPALARALAWSREVNRRLTAMPKECAPFAAVEGCLAAVRAVADVVAMGTGTPAAVRGEWTRGGLSGYTDAVFAAPQDGKAEALIPVFGAGYLPSHMLVVGDTLGDAALAAQAGALFFPILPGREEACWQRLAEEGFPKFLHGSFAGAYEDTLRKAQRSLLP